MPTTVSSVGCAEGGEAWVAIFSLIYCNSMVHVC